MGKRQGKKRLWDSYKFEDFRPSSSVEGVFGDPRARVITLNRRSKKQFAQNVERLTVRGMTGVNVASVICPVVVLAFTLIWNIVALSAT